MDVVKTSDVEVGPFQIMKSETRVKDTNVFVNIQYITTRTGQI